MGIGVKEGGNLENAMLKGDFKWWLQKTMGKCFQVEATTWEKSLLWERAKCVKWKVVHEGVWQFKRILKSWKGEGWRWDSSSGKQEVRFREILWTKEFILHLGTLARGVIFRFYSRDIELAVLDTITLSWKERDVREQFKALLCTSTVFAHSASIPPSFRNRPHFLCGIHLIWLNLDWSHTCCHSQGLGKEFKLIKVSHPLVHCDRILDIHVTQGWLTQTYFNSIEQIITLCTEIITLHLCVILKLKVKFKWSKFTYVPS